MKRYKMLGRPIGAHYWALEDRAIGELFEANFDEETEDALLAAGAVEIAEPEKKVTRGKTSKQTKD